LKLLLQYLLPHRILAQLAAKIANCRFSLIKNFIIKQFCKYYQVDLSEALETNYLNYPTFNDFFTRALKAGARPISEDPQTIISPADGVIGQFGKISNKLLINAKGQGFTLEKLLADVKEAAELQAGNFAVLYLAPFNYHRVHMPVWGKLLRMRYIPGRFFSVAPAIVQQIPDLFAKNERVVISFDTALGKMIMILVGAMIVGSIETVWSGVVANKNRTVEVWDYSKQNLILQRGCEVGRFKLGSTVILLFPEKSMEWYQNLEPNQPIKMGESLGKCGGKQG